MKTTTMNKPVITLKNIKHFAAGSQETHCYTATIYVDGERFATVENNGHGGCDNVHPITGGYESVSELETRIKATYPRIESEFFPGGLEPDLEIICGDLVNDHLFRKDFKNAMRKVSFTIPGKTGIYQLPAKIKPTAQQLASIKEAAKHPRSKWKDHVILNSLPEEQALALYKKHSV